MSWVRLDDGFADHPKIRKLSTTAFAVHVWALCHCGRHLTDGWVAFEALAGCPWVSKRSALNRAVGMLEVAGVWVREDGGYRIHDYDQYQPNRASVLEKRRQNAERVQRHRERKKTTGNGVSNALQGEGVTHPPTRPDPLRSPLVSEGAGGEPPVEDSETDWLERVARS
jgi:hypothetical protein